METLELNRSIIQGNYKDRTSTLNSVKVHAMILGPNADLQLLESYITNSENQQIDNTIKINI